MLNFAKIEELRGQQLPIYDKYPSQCEPQPAYIKLSECGEIFAESSGEIGGGRPSDEWHRRTLTWKITPCLSGDAIADLLQRDDIKNLLERAHAGHDTRWNGNNWVGSLTTDAEEAFEMLEHLFECVEEDVEIWAVADWLFQNCDLFDHWPADTQTMEEAIREIENTVDAKRALFGDIQEALLEDAQWRCRQAEKGLGENHLAALLEHGYADEEEVAEYREKYSMTQPAAGPVLK